MGVNFKLINKIKKKEEIMSKHNRYQILGMNVDSISKEEIHKKILGWVENNNSKYICIANVHMVMESYDSTKFRKIVNNADIITPDGMPLVWWLRRYNKSQERISGPDLTVYLSEKMQDNNINFGFYGSSNETLSKLKENILRKYPNLSITYTYSPPFRELEELEKENIIEEINQKKVDVLFVGLGCPKQEKWMYEQKNKINSVMLGVGAAFDFHAGNKKEAPKLLQKLGLEWLFRFIQEPKRLWKRYLKHNPRFIFLIFKELINKK